MLIPLESLLPVASGFREIVPANILSSVLVAQNSAIVETFLPPAIIMALATGMSFINQVEGAVRDNIPNSRSNGNRMEVYQGKAYSCGGCSMTLALYNRVESI